MTDTAIQNLTATMSPYGYPIARFDAVTLTISRRPVVVDCIIWDAEYGHFRAIGRYAKKDGTAGAQIAKPLMFRGEVPEAVLDALAKVAR
jgi:hypothetical protein